MSDLLIKLWQNGILQLGIWETIYMTLISTFFAYLIGLPVGLILRMTDRDGIHPIGWLNRTLGIIVNALRSIPFIILMVAIIPLTRLIAGTSIGTTAACVPLTIVAIPFLSRLVETSIRDVDFGLVEAAESMGATPFQIIRKVLIPEALPTIINNITVLIVNLIGASAMAGAIGGGGLGDIAIRYGHQRGITSVMWVTVVILIVLVQIVQSFFSWLTKKIDKRQRTDQSADFTPLQFLAHFTHTK